MSAHCSPRPGLRSVPFHQSHLLPQTRSSAPYPSTRVTCSPRPGLLLRTLPPESPAPPDQVFCSVPFHQSHLLPQTRSSAPYPSTRVTCSPRREPRPPVTAYEPSPTPPLYPSTLDLPYTTPPPWTFPTLPLYPSTLDLPYTAPPPWNFRTLPLYPSTLDLPYTTPPPWTFPTPPFHPGPSLPYPTPLPLQPGPSLLCPSTSPTWTFPTLPLYLSNLDLPYSAPLPLQPGPSLHRPFTLDLPSASDTIGLMIPQRTQAIGLRKSYVCQDLARIVPVLVTRCPHWAFLTLLFSLISSYYLHLCLVSLVCI
ncbi:uncharacterized protein [Salvelinus alpinus]|uniref:uncharacterized protein isoform X1 n=1 Tax=Salvelinus alpinus TaxID=8036 RepID=UPI0039FBE8CC